MLERRGWPIYHSFQEIARLCQYLRCGSFMWPAQLLNVCPPLFVFECIVDVLSSFSELVAVSAIYNDLVPGKKIEQT